MATNKNQHFVPRCHLRHFTKDEADKTITLFNLDHKKFVEQAPIKHQCAGSYFYGQDERLEKAIQHVESAYGSTVREIKESCHRITELHKMILRRFWFLQYLRTEAASRRSVEMAKAADAVIGAEAFSFRFGVREAVYSAMRFYAHEMEIIDDLKLCIIRNKTKIPFITSDDPAVATNRWYLEDQRMAGRSFGLRASGLLALLPLSPKILCLAYDGDVYSVSHERGWVHINNEHDIRAINQHQFLNCFANIYLHDIFFSADILSQYANCSPHRLPSRHAIHYAVLDYEDNGYSRYRVTSPGGNTEDEEAIIHSQVLSPVPTRWPSILRWKKGGGVYTNGTGLKYIRKHHALSTISHRPFWKEPVYARIAK